MLKDYLALAEPKPQPAKTVVPVEPAPEEKPVPAPKGAKAAPAKKG
jgi:hypothetical protein